MTLPLQGSCRRWAVRLHPIRHPATVPCPKDQRSHPQGRHRVDRGQPVPVAFHKRREQERLFVDHRSLLILIEIESDDMCRLIECGRQASNLDLCPKQTSIIYIEDGVVFKTACYYHELSARGGQLGGYDRESGRRVDSSVKPEHASLSGTLMRLLCGGRCRWRHDSNRSCARPETQQ